MKWSGRCWALLLPLFLILSAAAPAQAEQRIALVIGNANYASSPLRNPVNDARDIAQTLRSLGFDVILRTDATHREMDAAVQEFGQRLSKGGVGLFYFAGHGIQVQGENYLVPLDACINTEADVKFGCLNAGLVLGKMEDAGTQVNLVVLDACRNNPFGRGFRGAESGLAKMDAPKGSLIAYATAPGSVAADGNGRNGVYTKHLLENIRTPGLSLGDVFMRARMGVLRETSERQVPWESSSLTGYIYLAGLAPAPAASPAAPAAKAETQPAAPAKVAAPVVSAAPIPQPVAAKAEVPSSTQEAELLRAMDLGYEQWKLLEMARPLASSGSGVGRFLVARLDPDTAQSRRELVRLAEAGDPMSMEAYALFLNNGIGGPKDSKSARQWRRKAADAGYHKSLIHLGLMLLDGEGGPKDAKEGMRLVQQALAKDPKLNERLASYYDAEGHRDLGKRLECLRKAAAAGNPKAMVDLGHAYHGGKGVAEDQAEAGRWFRKAAEEGHLEGQRFLGFFYEVGLGMPKDPAQAAKWYRKSAEGGLNVGMYLTALCYQKGIGVGQNYGTAMGWYQKAAAVGEQNSLNAIGVLYSNGLGVAENQAEATRWFQKAAAAGNDAGMFNLGMQYEHGQGMQQNYTEAMKLYRRAADDGNAEAMLNLGKMYNDGRGVAQNYAEAFKLYRQAADKGEPKAQHNLGLCYFQGKGVPQNKALAYFWYSIAAASGFQQSVDARNETAKQLTTAELSKMQAEAARWKPKGR